MKQVTAIVDDRLSNAGDVYALAGHIDESGYRLGEHEFELPSGLDYDLVLTHAGDGILASGIVRAQVKGTCDRCLDDAYFDVASELDEYYLFRPPSETHSLGDDEDDADFSLVGDDATIDLTDAIWAAVVMETPFVVLCKEDCKGLCPICGENLNHVDCGHEEQLARDRMAASPFAALAQLKLDD